MVTLDYTASDYGGEIQSVAGNNVGYGATGGTIFIGGRAGHRLGIRNSGATIVAEAAGKYACEYMTRGRVLILGPVENEIGSRHDRRRAVRLRPGQRGAGEAARARAWR